MDFNNSDDPRSILLTWMSNPLSSSAQKRVRCRERAGRKSAARLLNRKRLDGQSPPLIVGSLKSTLYADLDSDTVLGGARGVGVADLMMRN